MSRAIVDACDAYPENAERWTAEFERLRGLGLSPEGVARALQDLHARIVIEVTDDYVPHNMSAEGDIGVSPNINTTPQDSIESKNNGLALTSENFPPQLTTATRSSHQPRKSLKRFGQISRCSLRKSVPIRWMKFSRRCSRRYLSGWCEQPAPRPVRWLAETSRNWPELAAAAPVMRVMMSLFGGRLGEWRGEGWSIRCGGNSRDGA